MGRLTRNGTAEPVSRDQILRREREQGSINFPCPADHEQDWQPDPVDPDSVYVMAIYTYTHPRLPYCLYLVLHISTACATSASIVGAGQDGHTLIAPWGYLNRKYLLLELPRTLLALCRRTLRGGRYAYAMA